MNFRHLFLPFLCCCVGLALLMIVDSTNHPAKPEILFLALGAISIVGFLYGVLNLFVDCLRFRFRWRPWVICPLLALFWAVIAWIGAGDSAAAQGSPFFLVFASLWGFLSMPSLLYGIPYTAIYYLQLKRAPANW